MNETIDIDDLVATISAGIYGDDRMSWSTIEAATTALSQLVAEVERLRGERAAVVAFLHAEAQRMYEAGQDRPAWFVLENRAEAIERGEHRREEEK